MEKAQRNRTLSLFVISAARTGNIDYARTARADPDFLHTPAIKQTVDALKNIPHTWRKRAPIGGDHRCVAQLRFHVDAAKRLEVIRRHQYRLRVAEKRQTLLRAARRVIYDVRPIRLM